MTKKKVKKRLKIEVTFKETPFEEDLYSRIDLSSKVVGKAMWMKLAAIEKLEREENPNLYYGNYDYKPNSQNQPKRIEPEVELPFQGSGIDSLLGMLN